MSSAIAIIKHTFSLIFNHIGVALRITMPWLLIFIAVVMGGAFLLTSGASFTVTNQTTTVPTLFWLIMPLMFVFALYAFFSCAIAWHRFILLDEQPSSIIAMPKKGLVWPYFKKSIAIMFISMIFYILGALLIAALAQISFGLILLGGLLLVFAAQYIILRMGIALPAAALGESDFGIRAAWEQSKSHTSTVFLTSLFSFLLFSIIYLIIAYFTSPIPLSDMFDPSQLDPQLIENAQPSAIGQILQAVVNWFYFVFGFGVLTTLYGVIVQEREI